MEYIKYSEVSLKKHDIYNEKWVQKIIADDPTILGLGDLELKDFERIQKPGGRLDLLLSDPETNRRYEVELQLGKLDETHIIRTIEYWDYERKKYPQYDHCAVIIAEDITSRFLNVISLFNGNIPIIAIQMKAICVGNNISLVFTKVLDELTYGTETDDEQEITDRSYWEKKANKKYLLLMDKLISKVEEIYPGYKANYNKHYIGLSKDGISQNFISFNPRKGSLMVLFKHDLDEGFSREVEESNLDALSYDSRWKQYRVRLQETDFENELEVILGFVKRSYNTYMK